MKKIRRRCLIKMWFICCSNYAKTASHGMEGRVRWRVPMYLWLPLIVCTVVLIFMVDIFQIQYAITPARLKMGLGIAIDQGEDLQGFLVKTPGCRIPYMNPFDKSIINYVWKEKMPLCNKGVPALVESDSESVFLVQSALENYTIQDISTLKCCYKAFYRKQPTRGNVDKEIKYSNYCVPFQEKARIKAEFIKVVCHADNNQTALYVDYFSFVPLKGTKKKHSKRLLNVLMIGLDAISRLNLHRQMPHTVKYLKEEIGALEFLGYNKVGDNTFPNLIPVLTGLSENELQKACWNTTDSYFDSCPFIWKKFKEKGYLTSYAEDSAWMGLFNYQRRGFLKQPTDYMWGIFNRLAEHHIGNVQDGNVMECIGARVVYQALLKYIRTFVTKMGASKRRYFSLFWSSSISHDYLNRPSIGDTDYYKFLKFLKEKTDLLEETVLVFMSDHGIRWGDIRQTYQGRVEERLPFLFIALPEWYKNRHKSAYLNLLQNTKRLITPFDLHQTLDHLATSFNLSQYVYSPTSHRGFSLFTPISPNRTCEDASIATHWCTCQLTQEISTNDTMVKEVAKFTVDHLNTMLAKHTQCVNLTLSVVLNAQGMTYGSSILNGHKAHDLTVTFETVPGQGVFEATVRTGQVQNATYQHEVIGTVSRLNLYGNQSFCIADFHLKLYCYCDN